MMTTQVSDSALGEAIKNEKKINNGDNGTPVPTTYKRTTTPDSTKSKIGQAAAQFLNGGEIDVSKIEGDHKDDSQQDGQKDPAVTPKDTAPADKERPNQQQNFRTLRDALDTANRQLEDLKGRTEKYKDYDEIAAKKKELEEKLQDLSPKYEELESWKNRYGLLRSDEYQQQFVEPRKQIEAVIKSELEADGLDMSVWTDAQATSSRRELEMVVNSHIDSELLKQQFYTLFFKDYELRKAEAQALQAPKTYMERVREEENQKRNTLKGQVESSYKTTWEDALKDADDMSNKLGENKIIEISFLEGNREHNEKVVAPILKVAHEAAEAELKERIENNLPVNRDIAARTIYKWRQAVASQAANRDRMRWYKAAKENEAEAKKWKDKYENLLSKASPTPGGNSSSSAGSNGGVKGNTFKERIGSLAEQVKAGS